MVQARRYRLDLFVYSTLLVRPSQTDALRNVNFVDLSGSDRAGKDRFLCLTLHKKTNTIVICPPFRQSYPTFRDCPRRDVKTQVHHLLQTPRNA